MSAYRLHRDQDRLFYVKGTAAHAVLILIGTTLLWRLVEAGVMDLIIGEAYYLASTRTPHLSYFDQPPLFLWMVWAIHALTGSDHPLILRLPFVLMFSLSTWVIYRIGARFISEWAGFAAALLMNVSILFTLSIGTWVQPEAPLMLFWLLTVWALADIFFDAEPQARITRSDLARWAIVGLWLGATFLSKYHAVFLVAGAGLFALTFAPARRWIVHPGPYLAVAIAALVGSPVLVWNALNEWASFDFQGARALGTSFHPEWLLRMILGQLAYISPWVALPVLAAIVLAFFKGPRARFPRSAPTGFAWFLAWLAILPIVFFTAVSAWSDTQFHFHWQSPGYMMGFLLLGGWMAEAWPRHRVLIKSWLALSLAINFAVMGVVFTHAATGWLRHVLPNGQTFEDPTTSAMKWRDLAQFFTDQKVAADPDLFVAGLSWITCGHIDTALSARAPLACLSGDPRNIAFNLNLRDLEGKNALLIDPWNDDAGRKAQFGQFFDSFTLLATLDMHRAGFPEIRHVHIVRATNFHLTQQLAPQGAADVAVMRLPRTRLAALKATIKDPGDVPLFLRLDGQVVASIPAPVNGTSELDLPSLADTWQVGTSTARLTLTDESGNPAPQTGFVGLEIRLE